MTHQETLLSAEHVSADTARAVGAVTLYVGEDLQMRIEPVRADFRTVPVYEGFDMEPVYDLLAEMYPGEDTYYQMGFQGLLKPDYDKSLTEAVDTKTLAVARRSEAFRAYATNSEPDEEGRTFSTCIWTGRAAARIALNNPDHHEAERVGRLIYARRPNLTHYNVNRHDSGRLVYAEMPDDWTP